MAPPPQPPFLLLVQQGGRGGPSSLRAVRKYEMPEAPWGPLQGCAVEEQPHPCLVWPSSLSSLHPGSSGHP